MRQKKTKKVLLYVLAPMLAIVVVVYLLLPSSPFAAILDNVDSAEIYYLDYPNFVEGLESTDSLFPIKPYGRSVKILNSLDVSNKELSTFVSIFRNATKPSLFSMTLCHFPEYGVRFYSNDVLVVETSICFACENFYAKIEDGSYQWHTLSRYKKLMDYLTDKYPSSSFVAPPQNSVYQDTSHKGDKMPHES